MWSVSLAALISCVCRRDSLWGGWSLYPHPHDIICSSSIWELCPRAFTFIRSKTTWNLASVSFNLQRSATLYLPICPCGQHRFAEGNNVSTEGFSVEVGVSYHPDLCIYLIFDEWWERVLFSYIQTRFLNLIKQLMLVYKHCVFQVRWFRPLSLMRSWTCETTLKNLTDRVLFNYGSVVFHNAWCDGEKILMILIS